MITPALYSAVNRSLHDSSVKHGLRIYVVCRVCNARGCVKGKSWRRRRRIGLASAATLLQKMNTSTTTTRVVETSMINGW